MQKRSRRAIPRTFRTGPVLLAVICSRLAWPQTGENVREESARKVLSVCELLSSPASYRGKVVTVRGIYWQGLRQGCQEIHLGNRTWPASVNLVESDGRRAVPDVPVIQTDRVSLDALDRLVVGEAKAGKREEIWATIVGLVRAPSSYVRADGRTVGGYGHLGVFPAEIIVERVLKTEIVSNPTYDYSEVLRGRPW
jgi:hypothetical protein